MLNGSSLFVFFSSAEKEFYLERGSRFCRIVHRRTNQTTLYTDNTLHVRFPQKNKPKNREQFRMLTILGNVSERTVQSSSLKDFPL